MTSGSHASHALGASGFGRVQAQLFSFHQGSLLPDLMGNLTTEMHHPHLPRALIMLWLGVLIGQPAMAAEKPLLSVGAEMSAPGEVRPSKDLARVVLGAIDKDDIDQLDDCLVEQGLKRADYASLLRAVRVSAGVSRNLWFVRPALNPYCHALYGAHLYRYFWIEEDLSGPRTNYRLLFKNGGDAFVVYPTQSHGLNDIEATGCIARGCRSARMSFDGREYRTVLCTETTFDSPGREVTMQRRCDSDSWRNDQASGLANQSAK